MKKNKVKLNKNAQRWVKALQSGKYKQATGALGKIDKNTGEDSYCCLGVACEIFNKDQAAKKKRRLSVDRNDLGITYDGESGDLSELPVVREWLGLIDDSVLIDFNDTSKLSFKQIAQRVLRNPSGCGFSDEQN